MSKKRKIVENSHHLLFMKKEWNSGYAKKLRERFIYKIPVWMHDELHHTVLQSVHKPSDELLRKTWEILQKSQSNLGESSDSPFSRQKEEPHEAVLNNERQF